MKGRPGGEWHWRAARLGEHHEWRGRRPGLARLEDGIDLARGLDRLPERDRRLLVFRYLLECSQDDIAAMWGLTKGGAQMAEYSALRKLRRVLHGLPPVGKRGRRRRAA